MLELNDITLSRGGNYLLEHGTTRIHAGQRVGLIGRNGCGKSTLLALLGGEIEPEHGNYSLSPGWRIASVRQETPGLSISALAYVLSGHAPYQAALKAITTAENDNNGMAIAKAHELFLACNGYAQPAKAAELLTGLGFLPEQHRLAVADFSGGWRMRLNLAQALISPAELLLLDEPTNHLDLDAVIWLQTFLKSHPATQIIIAHDREFLDALCNRILHIENNQLFEYTGNYSDFEHLRHQYRLRADAKYRQQTRQRNHLQAYIDRFRAKATKARQVQSRLKALEKLNAAPPPPPESDYRLYFPQAEHYPNPVLTVENAVLGYGHHTVIKKITLQIAGDARIGLLGRNGAGKSTLMKGLAGVLTPLEGTITPHIHSRIGYFTQHQLDALRAEENALWHMQQILPELTEQKHRDFFGRYGFTGDEVQVPVQQYSGGEKARLALALIIAQHPNVLLLDEPTNHLDIAMRDALTEALQEYRGAVILISHDRSLLNAVCDYFYLVSEGKVQPFAGDLEDYRRYLSQTFTVTGAASSAEVSQQNNLPNRREQKRLAAEKRKSLQPYKQKITQLEKQMEQLTEQLSALEEKLSDLSFYETDNKEALKQLLNEQIILKKQLTEAETLWLEAAETLHHLENQEENESSTALKK